MTATMSMLSPSLVRLQRIVMVSANRAGWNARLPGSNHKWTTEMMWNNTTVAPYNPRSSVIIPMKSWDCKAIPKEKDIVFGCVNYVTGTRPDAGSYPHFALQHPHRGFL